MQNAELEIQNFASEGDQTTEEVTEAETVAEEITEAVGGQTPAVRGNLSHLSSSVPRAASLPKGAMTKAEMREMREILGNIDDAELHRLYKRVTN